MSIKELEKYAKDNNTTNFQALIDLMQKKENALDYLAEYKNDNYKDIIEQYKAVAPITKNCKEMAENHAISCFSYEKPTVKQKEQFLNILSNSEPSQKISLAQKSHEIIKDLYKDDFFKDVSIKILFDSLNKIKPAICSEYKGEANLSLIAEDIFNEVPSVISNENDLLLFLNSQIDNTEIYYNYGCGKSKLCFYLASYSYTLNKVYENCLFDPDNVVMSFDKLSKIKEAIDLDVFSKPDTYIEIYGYCFIEDLSYEDLRKKINIDPKSGGQGLFEAKYYALQRDPVIFDDENTALSLIKSYIYKRNENLDILAIDPDFNDFIEELKQKLTIDVVEVLKNDKELALLYEVQKLKNELANF